MAANPSASQVPCWAARNATLTLVCVCARARVCAHAYVWVCESVSEFIQEQFILVLGQGLSLEP